MSPKPIKCPKCHKLFAPQPDKILCARCTERYIENGLRVKEAMELYGKESREDIAAFAGLALEEVDEMLTNPLVPLEELGEGPVCVSCKKRRAQPGAEYCLRCRMALNKALGTAVELVSGSLTKGPKHVAPEEPEPEPSVAETVRRKRVRGTMGRLDPTPRSRYSQ
jgi:hypothetical protein